MKWKASECYALGLFLCLLEGGGKSHCENDGHKKRSSAELQPLLTLNLIL